MATEVVVVVVVVLLHTCLSGRASRMQRIRDALMTDAQNWFGKVKIKHNLCIAIVELLLVYRVPQTTSLHEL